MNVTFQKKNICSDLCSCSVLGFHVAEDIQAWSLHSNIYSGVSNLFHAKFEMSGEMLISDFLVKECKLHDFPPF